MAIGSQILVFNSPAEEIHSPRPDYSKNMNFPILYLEIPYFKKFGNRK